MVKFCFVTTDVVMRDIGEIFVETALVQSDLILDDQQKEKVLKFHKYTYSHVLRLEKFPMIFKPEEANSSVVVIPLSNARNQCIGE